MYILLFISMSAYTHMDYNLTIQRNVMINHKSYDLLYNTDEPGKHNTKLKEQDIH